VSDVVLTVNEVTKSFGGLAAVMGLSFEVRRGRIASLIGPNGAGKTTLFNLVTGVLPVSEGEIRFEGEDITGLSPHAVAARGISRSFQTVELFGNMSVVENVMVGRHARTRAGLFAAGLRLPAMRREEDRTREAALALLELGGLSAKAHLPATSLPLGEQKILEVLRALAVEPRLMLLDEPAAGLNEAETLKLSELISAIRGRGVTVLLVEHDMSLVMRVSDDIVVMNFGRKIAEGPPQAIRSNPRVIEAYLGRETPYA
jgi:branched-chain amino acid transport system ATP-binding protein